MRHNSIKLFGGATTVVCLINHNVPNYREIVLTWFSFEHPRFAVQECDVASVIRAKEHVQSSEHGHLLIVGTWKSLPKPVSDKNGQAFCVSHEHCAFLLMHQNLDQQVHYNEGFASTCTPLDRNVSWQVLRLTSQRLQVDILVL